MFNKTIFDFLRAFFVIATIFSSLGLATSLPVYESLSADDKGKVLIPFIDKIVADIKSTSPDLSKKVNDYFYENITDKNGKNGWAAFLDKLVQIENLIKLGRQQYKNTQVETIAVIVIEEAMSIKIIQDASGTFHYTAVTPPATTNPTTRAKSP